MRKDANLWIFGGLGTKERFKFPSLSQVRFPFLARWPVVQVSPPARGD
jgi:hypothetical protein